MKKLISILLAVALLAGLSVTAFAVGASALAPSAGTPRAVAFSHKDSAQLQKVLEQEDAEAPSLPAGADWVDRNGTAYRFRDDVECLLFIGVDDHSDKRNVATDIPSNSGNADILALVVMDNKTNSMKVLDIPRDTVAELLAVDEKGEYRETVSGSIAFAHSFGTGKLSSELTVEAVSRLLKGVEIDRYLDMDHKALPELNEMLDGVELTFPEDFTDIDKSFTKGSTVRLTNQQFRRLITSLDKGAAQGAVERGLRDTKVMMRAIFSQTKQKIKDDPGSIVELFRILSRYITTDLSLTEVGSIGQQMQSLSFDDDTVIAMQGESSMVGKVARFQPDEQWLEDFVVKYLSEEVSA